MKKLLLILLLIPILVSGQKQIEIPFAKPCPYGYLEYIPACVTTIANCDTIVKCPRALLISLHGVGKRGNGTTDLHLASDEGIARLIRDGQWKRTEFIVLSPQFFANQTMFSPRTLHAFVEQMIIKYKPDPGQVYMVGLSAGANSIYPYITIYRDVRAVITIAGAGNYKLAYRAVGVRLWAFHVNDDTRVSSGPDKRFIPNYNLSADSAHNRFEHARLTLYPSGGHTGWQQTYTGQWKDIVWSDGKTVSHRDMNGYDHYNEDIYDWLLKPTQIRTP